MKALSHKIQYAYFYLGLISTYVVTLFFEPGFLDDWLDHIIDQLYLNGWFRPSFHGVMIY